jgi:uncharacterized protein YlxW (UPF0749 family)
MKIKGRHVILSVVCLVLGFMISFSYNLTKRQQKTTDFSEQKWDREYELRKQLIDQEEKNKKLQKELLKKQATVTQFEKDLSGQAQVFFNLAEDAEKYRLFLGKIKVKGKGVRVTLDDGTPKNEIENVNNYIVHEQHVFNVVNELYISGATAIAINGQRLDHNSYILCNGPVITVDGQQHPAPFTITAIGDPETMEAALNITGGVREQLLNDNINFGIKKLDSIELDPILGS